MVALFRSSDINMVLLTAITNGQTTAALCVCLFHPITHRGNQSTVTFLSAYLSVKKAGYLVALCLCSLWINNGHHAEMDVFDSLLRK